jgi:hypothetical protein
LTVGNQRTAQSDDKLLCVRWLAVAPRGERLGGVRLPITAIAICRPMPFRGLGNLERLKTSRLR